MEIDFKDPISIFMGPNGIGKSTVLNVFVHFLSRQWSRLSKQPFTKATIEFSSGESVSVSKSDCVEFTSIELPTRIQSIASDLVGSGLLAGALENEVDKESLDQQPDNKSALFARELRLVRSYMRAYPQAYQSLAALSSTSKIILKNFPHKLIYLPTYRRIEQDITEVLSMAPSTVRRLQAELTEAVSQSSAHYTELVRFGMEDIERMLDVYTSNIKEYSRQQINLLSTKYLVAALRARQAFDKNFFNSLTDTRIRDVLARVDDRELDATQRRRITELIKSLRERQGGGRLKRPQEHIADYFHMLAETHDKISLREAALKDLARLLNRYIAPKQAFYDQTRYKFIIRSRDADVPLSGLSSGEKQIVSLFTTLALSDEEDFFVVIDEPELSLSVLWQETLIEDIMSIKACGDLLAVTHSPFIYGERLSKYTRDLSDHTRLRMQ